MASLTQTETSNRFKPKALGIELEGGYGGISTLRYRGKTYQHASEELQVYRTKLFLRMNQGLVYVFSLNVVERYEGECWIPDDTTPSLRIRGYGSLNDNPDRSLNNE